MLAIVIVLLFPTTRKILEKKLGRKPAIWGRLTLIVLFFMAFVIMSFMSKPDSIYRSPKLKHAIYQLYEEKLADWPGEYESLFIATKYGRIHVIASGQEDAPPVLLLHASAHR